MKEFVIDKYSEGQRLDKFLSKCLGKAPKGFIYKMLRKKNITLNDNKADGSEKLGGGDIVKIYFSDETYEKFSKKGYDRQQKVLERDCAKADFKPDIVYEDEDILLVNKPAGMLSQKAAADDVSLNEYIIHYLLGEHKITRLDLQTFTPSVCNRLDRNTSGLVAAGKTMKGLQALSELFKNRTMNKYYLCLVYGKVREREKVKGFLLKDDIKNKVDVCDCMQEGRSLPIETEYMPVVSGEGLTLLKVHLITGRSHQIRAHLKYMGHPLIGDYKYGDRHINEYYKKKYGISCQVLHAYEMDMPSENIHVYTAFPQMMRTVLEGEHLWEHGIPEASEALH